MLTCSIRDDELRLGLEATDELGLVGELGADDLHRDLAS